MRKKIFKLLSLDSQNITPVFIIGLILKLMSIIAIIFCIFNELIGKGNMGTITGIVVGLIVFGVTHAVLLLERVSITEENKRRVIIGECLIVFILLGRWYLLAN